MVRVLMETGKRAGPQKRHRIKKNVLVLNFGIFTDIPAKNWQNLTRVPKSVKQFLHVDFYLQ